MTAYLSLPLLFLQFWYVDAPREIGGFFLSLNAAFLQAFSLPLLLKTLFKPAKNEYRKEFIGFSIGMGMALKTPIILVDIVLFVLLLFCEGVILLSFLLFPFATVLLLIL